MIEHLRIENLVIAADVELDLGDGLLCITGETGAGKTLITTAIGLLLGGDADASLIGSRGDEAYVEGVFHVADADFWEHPAIAPLAGLRPDGEDTLVLARHIYATGRTRATAWGRTASRADLSAAGELLVAVAGQHGQRRLTDHRYQRALVDAMVTADGNPTVVEDMRSAWSQLRDAREVLAAVSADADALAARREDVLDAWERIELVNPSLEEEADLLATRDRVRDRAGLQEAIQTATAALGEDDGVGERIGQAARVLDRGDDRLAHMAGRLLAVQEEVAEVRRELTSELSNLADAATDAGRVEERLAAYDELQRHFGGTTEAVLARWEDLAVERDRLGSLDAELDTACQRVAAAEAAATTAAAALTAARADAADQLAAAVAVELHGLGMDGARVEFNRSEIPLGAAGVDRLELHVAANAGMPPAPVATAASGGELSRIALSLQVASGATEAPTLVFDEIDAGIGGITAHAVASRLARLGERAQVLCVTHLPQVAALASAIVHVEKADGSMTATTVSTDDGIIDELCRMAGSAPGDSAARQHATELRERRFRRSGNDADAVPATGQLRYAHD